MEPKNQEEQLKNYVEQEERAIGSKMVDTSGVPKPWEKQPDQISLGNQIGWQKLPISDLPTKGLFYPEGAELAIRAANGGEIRHWSTLNTGPGSLSQLDDMLNYILERCVTFKLAGHNLSWKDLKEVDRFYVLLAVREWTFIKGENNLQVRVSENSKINVSKEMIDYINLDEELMKYYDSEKRCFNLKFETGKTILVDIPSVGVVSWIKQYIQRNQQNQQQIDTDFIDYAPFLIRDWRGLNDTIYGNHVINSHSWSDIEVSVLAYIRQMFVDTVNPIIKYVDEGGMEQTAPLNFLGGIKSIFLISNPLRKLQ